MMHKLARVAGGSVLLAIVVRLPGMASSRPYGSVDTDGFAAGVRPPPIHDTGAARVTVNPAAVLGTLPSTALGLNVGVWDRHFLDPVARALVRRAGITL